MPRTAAARRRVLVNCILTVEREEWVVFLNEG